VESTLLVLAVFGAVYVGMALGRWPGLKIDRTGIAILGAILLYVGGVAGGADVVAAIDFPTLLILCGLMILSAQFQASGFYAWCSGRIAGAPVGPAGLLGITAAISGVLSAVLANDVVVFAMTPMLCIGLLRRRLDPRPFLIALAGAANAGSAATILGNPQNILIGQKGQLDFWAFMAVCGPPALAGMAITVGVVLLVWRGRFGLPDGEQALRIQEAQQRVLDRGGVVKGLVAAAVLLLTFATPLPRVEGVLMVTGALLISRRLTTRRILGYVDWQLLALFAGLFVVTWALGSTGLPARMVGWLEAAGFSLASLAVLGPIAVVGSNTIGNVPLVVLLLAVLPHPTPELLYGLAVISTLAGNLLLVGSLANIITVERAKDVGVTLGLWEHARCGIPITVLSLAVAVGWLLLVTG
jgi:Na+/H+ antiporter NhaD/arsenite permease-like protein